MKTFDLTSTGVTGFIEQDVDNVTPDADGVLQTNLLILPGYERGIYYRPYALDGAAGNRIEGVPFTSLDEFEHRPASQTRAKTDNHAARGQFLLTETTDGQFLAVLPMAGPETLSFLDIREGKLRLLTATFGTGTVSGRIPLFAHAWGHSPYEASYLAWKEAIDSGYIYADWRHRKPYPELYNYLGWCSWEHFKWDINEGNMTRSVRDLEACKAPFRWVIVDDGYLHHDERQILSWTPDREKFPDGWLPVTALKRPDRIRWMGVWRNFLGYMRGVSPQHQFDTLREQLVPHESPEGLMHLPDGSAEAAKAFYETMVEDSIENGFDFTKVDFQSRAFDNYAGRPNPVKAMRANNEALENACHRTGIHLLNCIAQTAVNSFQTRYSAVSRNSEDYVWNNPEKNRRAAFQGLANNLWMGQTVWGDFDEFHSHTEDAQVMALVRAISGGPVYTSDEPAKIVAEVLTGCCARDGRIFRTLAPATLLPDSLFTEPFTGGKATRVVAPLANGVAAIGLFNFCEDGVSVETSVSPEDYPHAGELLQPYAGPWGQPEEGLLLFDGATGRVSNLDGRSNLRLENFSGRLLQVHPKVNGWAVIGRSDKYLPGAAVSHVEASSDTLQFTLAEAGPFLLWSAHGAPKMDGIEFSDLGNGLYAGAPGKRTNATRYTVTRSLSDPM